MSNKSILKSVFVVFLLLMMSISSEIRSGIASTFAFFSIGDTSQVLHIRMSEWIPKIDIKIINNERCDDKDDEYRHKDKDKKCVLNRNSEKDSHGNSSEAHDNEEGDDGYKDNKEEDEHGDKHSQCIQVISSIQDVTIYYEFSDDGNLENGGEVYNVECIRIPNGAKKFQAQAISNQNDSWKSIVKKISLLRNNDDYNDKDDFHGLDKVKSNK